MTWRNFLEAWKNSLYWDNGYRCIYLKKLMELYPWNLYNFNLCLKQQQKQMKGLMSIFPWKALATAQHWGGTVVKISWNIWIQSWICFLRHGWPCSYLNLLPRVSYIFIIVILLYWGYIVVFAKVLTIHQLNSLMFFEKASTS
jgi:hypothetical protein